jgi:hypothetical protein
VDRTWRLILIGRDLASLISLSIGLADGVASMTLAESNDPLRRAVAGGRNSFDAVVLWLTGYEDCLELQALAAAEGRVIFIGDALDAETIIGLEAAGAAVLAPGSESVLVPAMLIVLSKWTRDLSRLYD